MSIRIDRVVTKTGDGGETSLVGGKRVSKADLRVEAYGSLDELNSLLGVARSLAASQFKDLAAIILNLQKQLFAVGAELATPSEAWPEGRERISDEGVAALEQLSDKLGRGLPQLNGFIVPGGNQLTAVIHLARTVCRRVERQLVRFRESLDPSNRDNEVTPTLLSYLNRLSDVLFNLARSVELQAGETPTIWVPKAEIL